uniref:Reverse transcriptase Ty1/copia-type domain-containing protein n=1 Tax=Tanacetum cinerariifolium TaxID=118510 RepID=A0A6L2MU20_TANCI|nr:hypothetical protein [Tanacetum cinerariifolium]
MNYKLVVAGNQSNGNAGTKENIDAGQAGKKTVPNQEYILLPLWTSNPLLSQGPKNTEDNVSKKVSKVLEKESRVSSKEDDKDDQDLIDEFERLIQLEKNGENDVNSTNNFNIVSLTVNTASIKDNVVDKNIVYGCTDDPNKPNLEEIVYTNDDKDVDAEADMTNLDTYIPVNPILTTRIHKDHPFEQIIRDIHSTPQTRRMTKSVTDHGKPKKVIQALTYPSWIEAMQDELLLFKLQQGYTQEEGIDYDEVFAPVARIEAIRMFLAYGSFKYFIVYQMDMKSAFQYGKIKEEVYVCQPPGFEDPEFPDRVYKVEKELYTLHQAPKAWVKGDTLLVHVYVDDIIFRSTRKEMCTEFKKMMHKKFQMSYMGELTFFLGLQTASTPIETSKPLMKDEIAEDVDVYLYTSMIGSLMYLTSSRPDIMFAVCACARFQVTPKVSYLHGVKRIFRYLKGQPKLGLWYPKDSPFDLEAYTNSDYAGGSLDRKSTIGVFNDEYDTPSHTKKVFANMRRKGKDFSGTVTPLFPSMLASQAVAGEGDSVERAVTTAASLDVEQYSGGSPRCQEAMGDTIAQTRSERIYIPSYDLPLLGVNTPVNNEERTKLKELIDLCTKLSDMVLDLENVKDAQALEIKRVESSEESLRVKDASKQGSNSDKTKELNVAKDEHMFDLSDLAGTEVIVDQEEPTELAEDKGSAEKGVSAAEDKDKTTFDVSVGSPTRLVDDSTTDDVTLAETLMSIRNSASRSQKLKGIVFKEPSEPTATSRLQPQILAKDKGKGIMQEPEKQVKAKVGKDQIAHDADVAQRLQAELDEEARLEREREKEASNNFVPIDTESSRRKVDSSGKKVESSKKRTRPVLGEESVKRQKVKDDAEKAEIKACLEIVPNDDSAVNVESLATKYLIVFCAMLDDFDRQDVLDLYRLVKENFKITSPEGYDRLLWGDLITLFEPSEEDGI